MLEKIKIPKYTILKGFMKISNELTYKNIGKIQKHQGFNIFEVCSHFVSLLLKMEKNLKTLVK